MIYRKWNRRRRSHELRRFPGRNRHHFLKAKSLGGDKSVNNLLLMHIERHEAWHKLFGLMSAEEALELLARAIRMKKHQHYDHQKVA
jgi:hypothetical protein